ncbi:MAG: CPBP family intramembrane metalloprotease [Bdellovibrionales bacterium]|nr:CPBP family intramembrane metalloprotease [Bdellovibrionales bacterium]
MIHLILLTLIFLINDFLFIALSSFELALFFDYALRLIVIISLFKLFPKKELGFKFIRADFALLLLLIMVPIGVYLYGPLVKDLTARIGLEAYIPSYSLSGPIRRFDQTMGIFLVACSEEMLFRGLFPYKLKKLNPNIMMLLGSVVYSLAYWGMGPAHMIVSFIWGLLALILRDRISNIIPLIFAHFLFKLILSI